MENKLKYIKLGLVDTVFNRPIWDYAKIITPECPTIFSYSPKDSGLLICGSEELDKRLKVENIPSDIKMVRINSERETVFMIGPNLLGFIVHYPDTKEFKLFLKAIKAIIYRTLKSYGIPLIERGNDVFFLKDGLEKKFFGAMDQPTIDGWKVMIFSLTLDFDSELANKIYRFDEKKFTKKGEITDIGKIAGGLYEVNPDIDRDKLVADIIQKVGERYVLKVGEEVLSEDDLSKMTEFANKFDNNDWNLYARNTK